MRLGQRLLWDRRDSGTVPYWTPKAAFATRLCAALANEARHRIDQEYRRLLYVALTRARDRLSCLRLAGTARTVGRALARRSRPECARPARRDRAGGGDDLRIEQPSAETAGPFPASSMPVLAQPNLPGSRRQPLPAEPCPRPAPGAVAVRISGWRPGAVGSVAGLGGEMPNASEAAGRCIAWAANSGLDVFRRPIAPARPSACWPTSRRTSGRPPPPKRWRCWMTRLVLVFLAEWSRRCRSWGESAAGVWLGRSTGCWLSPAGSPLSILRAAGHR